MALKSLLKRTITVIVVPHAEAKFRQIKLQYWKIIGTGLAAAAILTGLSIFLLHYFLLLDSASKVSELYKENQTLTKQNLRYSQETNEIGKSLDKITRKTEILSSIAGVDQVVTRGRGDISSSTEQFGNEDLDREHPLQRLKIKDISATLERIQTAFDSNKEKLDHTPSIWPLYSTEIGYVSSSMGMRKDPFTGNRRMHEGVDISAPMGTPVIAPANGIVIDAKKSSGYGNVLVIDHYNNIRTMYGHLKGFNVKAGDRVKRGDIIGYVGNSGRSTSSHLHYQIEINSKAVEPSQYILNFEKLNAVWDFQFAAKSN
jgi:murein DD-endopeptidase MepM/ murein hydrolase activator NlpD